VSLGCGQSDLRIDQRIDFRIHSLKPSSVACDEFVGVTEI
jgi:hypothetical protein